MPPRPKSRKVRLALDSGVAPLALRSMAEEDPANKLLLCAIAKNPQTDADTLDKLARHPEVVVRRWVALHPNLSDEARALLASDPDESLQHKLRLGAARKIP